MSIGVPSHPLSCTISTFIASFISSGKHDKTRSENGTPLRFTLRGLHTIIGKGIIILYVVVFVISDREPLSSICHDETQESDNNYELLGLEISDFF